ncbi:Ti-type conjugative transfer relaxase TraA [Neorhizobium sp. T786]|uniref:Ti-type conjugative transfer relaxase TraA n=1 Tax=Pseudorhizobium xiangyangii TaxID=2883104 RepID=UPI001CFFDF49|nr:Ti-type conjugative transfer relaxase TraA [Neorhizobium xiangyangii]MCB5205481.1 Ti-type conjugative transfer relaxase TraA [Neorhizobium xiangyangii]
MVHGRAPAEASEAVWNRIQNEERANGSLAREIIIALPIELSRDENIALMREFVSSQITSLGVVADWVYHDAPGNPHVHLMHTERPVEAAGFGKKKIAVLDEDGKPLKVNNRIVYNRLIGDRHAFKDLRLSWGDTVNRHLALAGHEARVDMRSFRERGIDLVPTTHLGPAGTAVQRKIGESQAWAAREAARFETADKIMENPNELLKLISNERSTFTEKDIAKALHRFIDDPTTFANVRTRVMASADLVEVRGTIIDPQNGDVLTLPVYSTREIIRIEHDMAVAADKLAQTRGFGSSAKTVAQSIRAVETKDPSRPFQFDPEQVAAVEHVTSGTGIATVVGFAGAGKSTLLEAANKAWVTDGRRVFGAALAGKAAEGLEESAGIASRTLASWELSWKNGRDRLQPGDVFVIDEAGMVASNQLSRFITAIEQAGAKAVLVGDAMQLQPIEAGAAFRAVTERVGYVELVGIRRQKEEWGQEASRQFARGQVGDALEAYRSRGHIVETVDKTQAIDRIVVDWMQARTDASAQAQAAGKVLKGDELLVLAHTNADVFALNAGIREAIKGQGELAGERAFVTERGTRHFAVGDRAIFLKNERFEEKLAPELGQQQVKNGMLGTVIATAGRNGEDLLRIRLDNGREVAFNPDTYRNIDHGYAATVHKSQGVTVDRVFVMASKSMDQHLSYVAMSRHRHQVTMYAPQSEFKSFDTLAQTLGRSGAKSTTLDFANESSYRAAVDAFAERRGIETLTSIAPAFAAFVDRQKAWIEEKREQVSTLWTRVENAMSVGRQRSPVNDVSNSVNQSGPEPVAPVARIEGQGAGFAPVTSFARSMEDDAKIRLTQTADWRERLAQMQPIVEKVYRDPQTALQLLSRAASTADARLLARTVIDAPQFFGALRGGESIVVGRAERAERAAAVAATTDLSTHVRSLAQSTHRHHAEALTTESERRAAMQVAVPELSDAARLRLDEMEAVRRAGSVDAYRDATRIVMQDKTVAQELATVAAAIADRFGEGAFTDRAGELDSQRAFERVADADRAHLEKVTEHLAAIRRFAGEVAFVEKLGARPELEKTSVPAARTAKAAEVAVPSPSVSQAPMFASVTSFANSVEEAARTTVRENAGYRQYIDALTQAAARIWQDPSEAVARVERAIATGGTSEGIEKSLREDPARGGELRGSDRLLDRFTAAGTERQAAMAELPAALAAVRMAASVYGTALENELVREKVARERMSIEIPALSDQSQKAAAHLSASLEFGIAQFEKAVGGLSSEVKAEFKSVNDALNQRFGRNAFANESADLARFVAPGQREALNQVQAQLKLVQTVVRTTVDQKHQVERQIRAMEQGGRLTR